MLKPTLAVLLALVLAAPARAEQPPDARALLQKVGDTYRGLDSYRFVGTMDVTVSASGQVLQKFQVPMSVAAQRSGRSRVEMQNPQMGMLLVSDGKEMVTYLPSLKQYTRRPADAVVDSSGRLRPSQGSPLARYFDPLDGLKSAKLVGAAPARVGGASHDCWVVRCDVAPPQALAADSSARAVSTYWVDKARTLVLEESTTVTMRHPATGAPLTMDQVSHYDVGEVNVPLADSLFAFRPPADAQEVSAFTSPGQPPPAAPELVGTRAPAFALKDTRGQTVSLAALRGKVVVLDFWATWCGPCRIEMPRVEKLHQELKTKGLVVMGVNTGESASVVKSFLVKNPYSFRVLLDESGAVGGKYKTDAIPTLVVIGRDGRIRSYFRGVTEENTLRQAVNEALAAAVPPASRPARRASTPPKGGATPAPRPAVAKPKS